MIKAQLIVLSERIYFLPFSLEIKSKWAKNRIEQTRKNAVLKNYIQATQVITITSMITINNGYDNLQRPDSFSPTWI